MKRIQLSIVTLCAGALISCVAHSQPPGNNYPPPGSQSGYGDSQGYDQGYGQGDDRYYGERQAPQVEVGFFYNELSPYGDWVVTRDRGWAWFPRYVPPYWRPYNDGRWTSTQYGWTWVSNEPFGWATYHYGRWEWNPRYGWLWYPDTVWGPAWVSWQSGGGYVGWAPLPPQVRFEIGFGLRLGGFDLRIGIRPDAYNFVPERSFLSSRVSSHLVPQARNVTIIQNTTNITNYTYVNNVVINSGVDVHHIEQVTGQRVQRLRLAEGRSRGEAQIRGDEVRIYRPEKRLLDTVHVGGSAKGNQGNQGRDQRVQRSPAKDVEQRPAAEVAPRVDRSQRPNPQQFEKQERRQKQELDQHLAQERQRLEKIHQQESAKARSQDDRRKVEQRQKAEIQALQQERNNAAKALEARQKAQREAVQASPPAAKESSNAVAKKGQSTKKEQSAKKEQSTKKSQGKGKEQKKKDKPPA